jgi:hypothetical protein
MVSAFPSSYSPHDVVEVFSEVSVSARRCLGVQSQGVLTLPPLPDQPPDFERLAALAAEHGIEILRPPGALPEQ